MISANERGGAVVRDFSLRVNEAAAEWEDVVAAHRRDDWPPPEWLAVVEGPAHAPEGRAA